jgi:hypothetical protein
MMLTVLAFSGVANLANAAAPQAGDLIKMDGLSAVYYLDANSKRDVFVNSSVYFSWYKDFSTVVTVSASELQSYPLGSNITMRPGTSLVKITTDPSVYAVTPNGVLRKIASEANAIALYGNNWAKRVVDVPDAFFTNYTIGTPLASGEVPAGSLVKNANSSSVYYFDGTNYRNIANEAAFNANNFSFANVITVSNAITASGTPITAAESAIVNPSNAAATTGVQPNSGTGLTASLSATTPASATVVSVAQGIGQSIAPMTSFNLTASNDGAVTIKSIRLQRIGVSSDNSLANIYLYNGNTKLTDAGNLSSGYVTFSNNMGIVTIPAGQTVTLTARADIANVTGGTIGLAIASASDIVASGVNVSGAFPLNGNLMSITQVTDLATVQGGIVTPSSIGTVNAGTLANTLWSSQLTVGQKAVKMSYVAFRQIGSIPTDAIQNIGLYVNGSQVGTNATIGSDGYVRFDLSASPVTFNTGASTLELRGDIVKGSNYNYIFSIQTTADIVLTDTNYGVNVAITNGTSGSLPLSAAQTTINKGSVSVQKDPNFTATQFVANQAQTAIGQWTMKAYGEDIKVQQLQANVSMAVNAIATSSIAEGFNNLTLYVNGGSVGSSQNDVALMSSATNGSVALRTITFGSTNLFTIPAGTTVTVTLKGDSILNPGTTVTGVTASLVAPISAYEGLTSFTYTPTSPIPSTANQLTVGTANATIANNTNYTNQTLSGNSIAQKIGSYIIQASSADGVKVTSLNVGFATSSTLNDIANLYIVTPDMPNGSQKVNPATSNNFTTNFTIPVNGTAQVDVYADLTNTSDSYTTTLTGAGLGVTSNQSVALTLATGQTITVGLGSLNSFALSNSSPVSQIVVGGTANQAMATYNFVAGTTGGVNISELGFDASGTAISSVTVGGNTATVVNGKALVTGLNLVVPAGYGGLDVPVTVNFTPVGLNGVADQKTQIALAHVKYLAGGQTTSIGDLGGDTPFTTSQLAYATSSNTMQVAGVAPVVSLIAPAGTLTTGTVKIGSVTIVAPTGNMTLNNLPLVITGSGATTTTGVANSIIVKDASNGSTISTASTAVSATDGSTTVSFTGGYTIAAGSAGKTFDIYAPVGFLSTSTQSGSARINLVLGAPTGFNWFDVNGNVALNGVYILNYPNTTVSSSN